MVRWNLLPRCRQVVRRDQARAEQDAGMIDHQIDIAQPRRGCLHGCVVANVEHDRDDAGIALGQHR